MIIIRYSLIVAYVQDDFGAMFHINTSRLDIDGYIIQVLALEAL
jgi:hypothetical protein